MKKESEKSPEQIAQEELEEQQRKIKTVSETYTKLFYREMWANKKMPFAKEWLLNNDKEWFERNENINNIYEAFHTVPVD